MSFLRSVIVDEAVVVDLADVAGAQPAVLAEHLARRLLVLVVAGEDGLAPDQQLAVVGDAQLDAGQRRPDRAEPEPVGPVDRRRGRALGQPVALEDRDVERVEELGDLLRERRAARDAERAAGRRAAPSPSSRRAGRRAGAAARARAGRARPCCRSSLTRRPTRSAQSMQPPLRRRSPRRTSPDAPCAPSRRRAARSAAPSGAPPAALRHAAAGRGRRRSCSRRTAPSRCISRPKLCASGR